MFIQQELKEYGGVAFGAVFAKSPDCTLMAYEAVFVTTSVTVDHDFISAASGHRVRGGVDKRVTVSNSLQSFHMDTSRCL
jgi:hypothetical protein